MRIEIVPRLSTFLMHQDDDGVRPTSGLELFKMGAWGVIFSLRGPGFYDMVRTMGAGALDVLGVTTLVTAVSPLHLRAMRTRLKGMSIEVLEETRIGDHEFVLVLIRAKPDVPTPKTA